MRPKSLRRHRHFDFLAELDIGLELLRQAERNLVVLVRDLLDDDQLGVGLDLARFRVDLDAQIPRRADRLAGGREHGVVDRFQEHFTFDALVALKKVEAGEDFAVHRSISSSGDKKKWVLGPLGCSRNWARKLSACFRGVKGETRGAEARARRKRRAARHVRQFKRVMIKVIFFDAVGTLFHLPRGVGWHYREVAERHGCAAREGRCGAPFAGAWKEMPRAPASRVAAGG